MTDAKVWLCLFRVAGPEWERMIHGGVSGDVLAGHAM